MKQIAEDWQYYETINERRESIVTLVNLSLLDRVEVHTVYPWLASVLISHADENKVEDLIRVQQTLLESIGKYARVQYVARIDKAKASELYFYADRKLDISNIVHAAVGDASRINVSLREDPNWTAYNESLLPHTESQRQQVTDSKVISMLAQQGDDPKLPRVIHHWLQLRNEADLRQCQLILEKNGFKHHATRKINAGHFTVVGEFTQQLPKLTLQSINEATVNLMRLVHQLNGKYDGWQSKVMR